MPTSLPRFAASALLCLAVAGCAAVGPDFRPAVPAAPADWSAWHGGSAALLELPKSSAGPGAAPVFDDPVLRALLHRALAASPDLQSAALHFAQSRMQERIVAAQGGPQLNASAAAARQRQSENGAGTRLIDAIAPANREHLVGVLSEPFDLYQAGFDASWELDMWGRVGRSLEAAGAGTEAAAATLRQVQLSVANELARRYLELRGVQRQLRLAQAELSVGEETLELARVRADSGLGNDIELSLRQAQLAELRARLPVLQEQEAQAINQITLLAGARPGEMQAELAASGDAGIDDAALPDLALGIPSEVAARRPDIQAAQARLHAATAAIGIATADLYPRISLGARIGVESLSGDRFGDWESRLWSVGPSLSLPLFDQGRRRATVQLRGLEQQEAAVAWQQTVLGAWHEIDSALSTYGAARQRQRQLADKVRSNQAGVALAHVKYANGLTDMQPELEARRSLLQAERDQAQGATALGIALVSIYKSIGAGPVAEHQNK
jgi:NodT family efflux transporter outer membrane factor (OMF) lipoprotein